MRQLELKDICGYLPYNLKRLCENKNDQMFGKEMDYHLVNANHHIFKQHKPILRQVSDLYKTIIHNGEEIVPIVELAKKTKYDDGWYFNRSCKAISRNGHIFEYDIYRGFKIDKKPSEYQYQLFDYLHELKIDYRYLIDSGLAIDANKLKTNPYK